VSPAPIGVVFEDAELERSVRSGLDEVETGLRAAVRSDNEILDISARHLVDAGGKRFRPLLTLLSSHFGDPGAPEIITAGVVVELTHLATLYHDDVMDEALVRRVRHRPTLGGEIPSRS
jgi:heptaprenyl diphosphate synthase